jgi:hypothetical protein
MSVLRYKSSPEHAISTIKSWSSFSSLDLGGGETKTDASTYMQKSVLMLVSGLDVVLSTDCTCPTTRPLAPEADSPALGSSHEPYT